MVTIMTISISLSLLTSFLLLLLLLVVCPTHARGEEELTVSAKDKERGTTAQRRPNIVFIMADDLGFNDVGYHNRKGTFTPTIDRLARQGVRLENYYVQPVCAPTRSQFMSGRSQIHTGLQHRNIMRNQPTGLPLDSLTMADKLKEAGYATAMVGKWHLGFYHRDFLPTRRGFDSFYGMYLGSGDHFMHSNCLAGVCAVDLHNDTTSRRRTDFTKSGVYSTTLFTNEAARIIKHRSKEDNPFFLFLSYQAVHSPVTVPRHYKRVVARKMRRRRLSRKRENFVAMTYAMDCGIKRVVKALKNQGVWDNTVLVFSTDNGGVPIFGGSNHPLKGQKRDYYEGGVRGVGFVNSPLFNKTGYINREMIHVTDWFPTFMSLANGNLNGTRDVNGFDQWKTLSYGAPTQRDEILYNIDPLIPGGPKQKLFYKHESFDTRMIAALRKGDYKIITGFSKSPGVQLFNIKEDPLEKNNLLVTNSSSWSFRPIADQLLSVLQRHQSTAVPVHSPRVESIKLGRSWQPWRKRKLPRTPLTRIRGNNSKWMQKMYHM